MKYLQNVKRIFKRALEKVSGHLNFEGIKRQPVLCLTVGSNPLLFEGRKTTSDSQHCKMGLEMTGCIFLVCLRGGGGLRAGLSTASSCLSISKRAARCWTVSTR